MRKIVHPISTERHMALVDRVKNILLSPRTEWPVIDAEPATVASLYTGYIMPLAAIPAICRAVGSVVFGISIPFGDRIHIPATTAITSALITFVMQLVGVYLFAFIVDALAPTFGGTKNMVQALKTAAYSATPVWVLGILSIFPGALISLLQLIGALYMLYLFFISLPIVMKAPQDKSIGYALVSIVCMIIVVLILGTILGMLGLGMGGMMGMGAYRP
jgi:hypothetical protein